LYVFKTANKLEGITNAITLMPLRLPKKIGRAVPVVNQREGIDSRAVTDGHPSEAHINKKL
jgi:hypothetical protein